MEADWNFNDGIKALINQINTGLRYATSKRYPISNPETVDIAMRMVLKMACSERLIRHGTQSLRLSVPGIIVHNLYESNVASTV